MKKTLTTIILFSLIFIVSGCSKVEDKESIVLSSSKIKQSIKSWKLYTNPAYRYELRFPKNWQIETSGEDGVWASFHFRNKVEDIIKITSHINWKDQYSLAEFYAKQSQDLMQSDYEKEEVEIGGEEAVWFKNVKGRVIGQPEAVIDLVALELDDRIIEIEIFSQWQDSRVVVNSLRFYPARNIIIE